METVTLTLWLLLLVSITGLIAQTLPSAFPMPLLQIILGTLVSYPACFPKITLSPELFMILFIPPLLFLDSWRLPQREFFRLKKTILGLAIGLTLLNVLLGGYLIHRWITPLPLEVSFVLAAILSPTDVVAVLAITKRLQLPSITQHLLEGEALINDASSLIALKFALTAAITGTFSFGLAIQQFVSITFGGIGLGVLVAYLFNQLRSRLMKPQLTTHALQTLLLFLLLPFGTYLIAEHYGLSGILAVVATGMSLSHLKLSYADSSAARLQARSFWPFLEFIFNGLIFLLLGLQIPQTMQNLSQTLLMDQPNLHLLITIGGITLLLLLLRLAWLVVSWLLTRWLGGTTDQASWLNRADLGSITFSGIRGAITLAAALSLPMNLPDGTPFPARELLIVIAVGVILSTLLLGALVLPYCIKPITVTVAEEEQTEEQQARIAAWQAALQQIEQDQQYYHRRLLNQHDDPQLLQLLNKACDGLKQSYFQQQLTEKKEQYKIHRPLMTIIQRLQQNALQAERQSLYQLRLQNSINDITLRKLERELDLKEAALNNTSQYSA
jgi:CPA1 family monovalent cation:H+ antiporter